MTLRLSVPPSEFQRLQAIAASGRSGLAKKAQATIKDIKTRELQREVKRAP